MRIPIYQLDAFTDHVFGVIATAPGSDCDFVSRFFGPRGGEIYGEDRGARVTIAGRGAPFMQGHITL